MVSLTCIETIAFEIEKQSLKEMSEIKNPVTSSFQHLDFMIKAFDKTAGLSVGEVVGDLLEPIIKGRQEAIETLQSAQPHFFLPLTQGLRTFLFGLSGLEDGGQVFAQLMSLFQLRRAFKKQLQLGLVQTLILVANSTTLT